MPPTAAYDGWPGSSDVASDDAVEHADDAVTDQSTKEADKRWGAPASPGATN